MLMLEEIYKSKNLSIQTILIYGFNGDLAGLKALELDQELEFKFISLWISFNSIYAQETEVRQDQQSCINFWKPSVKRCGTKTSAYCLGKIQPANFCAAE